MTEEADWQPIEGSSNVAAAALAPNGLLVRFLDGAEYLYVGAGQDDLDGLLDAASAGRFVNTHLKARFPAIRV